MSFARITLAMRRLLSTAPSLRRVPACPDLNLQYQLRAYEEHLKAQHNLYVHTDDNECIGTEEEVFTPTYNAVRRAQRQSTLLEKRRSELLEQRQSLFFPYNDTGDEQATAGASYPNSPATTVFSASPAPRSSRPILPPINIALANTLGNLTGASPTDVYVTETCDSEYVLHGHGQPHLQASWRDVQIMSRAGNAARERRRKC